MTFDEVSRTAAFERDMKSLLKKYRTLEEDLEVLVKSGIVAFHKLGIDNAGIVQIPRLGFSEPRVYKVKKFACRSLKGTGRWSAFGILML